MIQFNGVFSSWLRLALSILKSSFWFLSVLTCLTEVMSVKLTMLQSFLLKFRLLRVIIRNLSG